MMTLSEIQLLLSAPQAASGYTSPGSVYNSNGRWVSTTQLNADVALDNLFPDLTGPQNAASQVDYQCLFVFNSDTTTSITNIYAWIPSSSITGPVDWAVGADTTGTSAYNSFSAQAGYITSPTIVPSTVMTWYAPSLASSGGAAMGTIGPQDVAALWIRRTATNSPAFTGAGFDLQVTFDVVS